MEFFSESDGPQRECWPEIDEAQSDEPQRELPESDEPESDEPLTELDEKLIPKSGMVFKSAEELYNFYLGYAREVGFGIRKKSLKKDVNGKLKYFSIQCVKGGTYKSVAKHILYPRPSKKIECKAIINAVANDEGELIIFLVNLDHNHALSPRKTRFFKCNKNIDAYAKRRLEINDQAGIRLSKNFQSLATEAGGYGNLTFTERDCRNHMYKVREIRLGVGDAASLSQYFASMQKRNPNFFYLLDFAYVVSYDERNVDCKCSCRLFEFKGIICRHIVKVFIAKRIFRVPCQYILNRWRKCVKITPARAEHMKRYKYSTCNNNRARQQH